MAEAWLTYADQTAVRHSPADRRAVPSAAVPEEIDGRRQRWARWFANAVCALCAVIGVLVVSIAAVVLGLT